MQDDCKTRTRKWKIRFSKEARNAIVLEYLTTGISQVELAEKYGIPTLSSISNWVKKYRIKKESLSLLPKEQETPCTPMEEKIRTPEEKTRTPEEEIAALKAKLKEMEESLAVKNMQLKQTELQNLALNTILDIAAEQGNDLRKKSGAKQ